MEKSEIKKFADGEKEKTSVTGKGSAKVMNIGAWPVQNVEKGGLLDQFYRKPRK